MINGLIIAAYVGCAFLTMRKCFSILVGDGGVTDEIDGATVGFLALLTGILWPIFAVSYLIGNVVMKAVNK